MPDLLRAAGDALQAGSKIGGETMPQVKNRVTLARDCDEFGRRKGAMVIATVTGGCRSKGRTAWVGRTGRRTPGPSETHGMAHLMPRRAPHLSGGLTAVAELRIGSSGPSVRGTAGGVPQTSPDPQTGLGRGAALAGAGA